MMLSRMYSKRLKGYAALGYQTALMSAGKLSQNLIYGMEDYLDTFSEDIQKAEKEIVIASPYVAYSTILKLRGILIEAVRRRVAISILCRSQELFSKQAQDSMAKALDCLQSFGANICFTEASYHRYAIFDSKVVWYGGINLLGGNGEENVLRIVSNQAAEAIRQRKK